MEREGNALRFYDGAVAHVDKGAMGHTKALQDTFGIPLHFRLDARSHNVGFVGDGTHGDLLCYICSYNVAQVWLRCNSDIARLSMPGMKAASLAQSRALIGREANGILQR